MRVLRCDACKRSSGCIHYLLRLSSNYLHRNQWCGAGTSVLMLI